MIKEEELKYELRDTAYGKSARNSLEADSPSTATTK